MAPCVGALGAIVVHCDSVRISSARAELSITQYPSGALVELQQGRTGFRSGRDEFEASRAGPHQEIAIDRLAVSQRDCAGACRISARIEEIAAPAAELS